MNKYISSDSYALLMALRCGYVAVEYARLTGIDNWITRWFWQRYVEWHPQIKENVIKVLRQIEQMESEELEAWFEISKEKVEG